MFGEKTIYGQKIIKVDSKSRIVLPAFTYAALNDELLVLKSDESINIVKPNQIDLYLEKLENMLFDTTDISKLKLIEKNIREITNSIYRKEEVDKARRICLGSLVVPEEEYRVIGAKSYVYLKRELKK